MKKKFLTLMFVIAFLCVGASAASAKNSSPSANPVVAPSKLSPAKTLSNKTKSLKTICKAAPCDSERDALIAANAVYDSYCGPIYPYGCEPALERDVQEKGAAMKDVLMDHRN